jgi:hypothetical protein
MSHISELRDMCRGKATDEEIDVYLRENLQINASPDGALIVQNEFNLGRFIKELFVSYRWYLVNYPVRTKASTSAIIGALGELLGSYVKSRMRNEKYSPEAKRVLLFAAFGGCITGPLLHFWYVFLQQLMAKLQLTGRGKTIAMVLLDRILWSPPFTALTVIFLQYFQTFSVEETGIQLRRNYAAVLLMSQKTWVPGQIINFEFVPVDYQVVFVNLVAVFYNTYLSLAN